MVDRNVLLLRENVGLLLSDYIGKQQHKAHRGLDGRTRRAYPLLVICAIKLRDHRREGQKRLPWKAPRRAALLQGCSGGAIRLDAQMKGENTWLADED